MFTEVERIDHQIELLQRKKKKAQRRERAEKLRGSLRRLACDESLPVCDIVARALWAWHAAQGMTLMPSDSGGARVDAGDFAARLDQLIDDHLRTLQAAPAGAAAGRSSPTA